MLFVDRALAIACVKQVRGARIDGVLVIVGIRQTRASGGQGWRRSSRSAAYAVLGIIRASR